MLHKIMLGKNIYHKTLCIEKQNKPPCLLSLSDMLVHYRQWHAVAHLDIERNVAHLLLIERAGETRDLLKNSIEDKGIHFVVTV